MKENYFSAQNNRQKKNDTLGVIIGTILFNARTPLELQQRKKKDTNKFSAL